VRIALFETLQADQGRVVVGEARRFVGAAVETEQQVLPHREPREHRAALRDEDALGAGPLDDLAVDRHASRVGPRQARHDVKQRSLAAPRWAHDGDELAVGNREAHAGDDRQEPVVARKALGEAFDGDLNGHIASERP
jgi:hypothetical protein